jgi:hypothetical protein
MLRGLIAFSLAAGLAISGAQAQDVAGTWAVNFDGLIQRTPDGREQVAERGKAQLIIEVKGDSAFGKWIVELPNGQQHIRKLRGTRKGNAVTLISDVVPGTVHRNGQITPVTMINTYEATVTGDAIVGTLTSRPENAQVAAADPRVRKFDGKREKR